MDFCFSSLFSSEREQKEKEAEKHNKKMHWKKNKVQRTIESMLLLRHGRDSRSFFFHNPKWVSISLIATSVSSYMKKTKRKEIKTKDEYKQSELDELEMIMCPNYPECNGDLMDFIPVEE